MTTAPAAPCTNWSQLAHVLPAEQREQLAAIILARLAVGWGEVIVIVKDAHVKEFREVNTVPATKPNDAQQVP